MIIKLGCCIIVAIVGSELASAQTNEINCVDALKSSKQITSGQLIDCLGEIEGRLTAPSTIPVGTIIASVLKPELFARSIGEVEGDAVTARRWVLADGSTVLGSEYARLTANKQIPDLRGMFLRGLVPGDPREAGEVQDFATALPKQVFTGVTSTEGSHDHAGGVALSTVDRYNAGGSDYWVVGLTRTGKAGEHSHSLQINGGGDTETRPRNAAVYYYIKIN